MLFCEFTTSLISLLAHHVCALYILLHLPNVYSIKAGKENPEQ